jgi:SAM-dependent methyltransferase
MGQSHYSRRSPVDQPNRNDTELIYGVPLACPKCHRPLDRAGDTLRCQTCNSEYPIVEGRPHFLRPPHKWSPPAPEPGGRFRHFLAHPPHPARLAGEISTSGVSNDHRLLRDFLATIPDTERVLDLGSGQRRLRAGVLNLDVVPAPNVDIIADGHHLPFPDAVFRAIVLQSVIEHVLEPARMLAECARVLQPGGEIWVEAPFLYPVHDPSDYYRWTLAGLRYLVSSQFSVERSGTLMGPATALSLTWRAYANYRLRRFHWGVRNSVAWMTGWLKRLDGDEVMTAPPEIYAHTFVLGVKAQTQQESAN